MTRLANLFRELRSYPSAVAGVSVIVIKVIIAIYAMVTIPYSEAVRPGGAATMAGNAPNAPWINNFRREKLPRASS